MVSVGVGLGLDATILAMPSVLLVHGHELQVHEDRDHILSRIMYAEGHPLREGGQPAGPVGWIRVTDTASNAELLVQASSIGYVRHA